MRPRTQGLARDLAAAAFLGGLAVVFFLPFLFHPSQLVYPASGLGSDVSYINWPLQTYYVDRLRAEGAFPLWDSRFMLGRPLAGDPHVLWLYPSNLLLLWLPTAFAFNVAMAAQVGLAGIGMYVLLRRGFDTSRSAAVLGALAFMFMPKFMAQIMGVQLAFGLAWTPLAWLGVRLAAKEGDSLAGALGGAALALLTPIHAQTTYYAIVTAGVYFLWLQAPEWLAALRTRQRSAFREPWRALGAFGACVASWGLLAAPIWLPLVELLPYTSRQQFTLADASYFQLPPALLLTLLAPTRFQFPEWTMFVGVLPPLLAFAALVGPRRREGMFFLALALFALVYALGTQTPLFGLIFYTVPGAGLLRVPTRLWAFGGAAIAVLAGLGSDALNAPEIVTHLRRNVARLKLIGAAYFGGGIVALAGTSWIAGRFQGQVLMALLVAASVVGLGRAYWRGSLSRSVFCMGLCLALMADLIPLAGTFFMLEDPARSFLRSSPALDFIVAQPGLFRTYATHKELSYAAAAARGIETLDGALSFQIGHAVEIIKAASGCELEGFATGVPPCLTAEIDKDAYRQAQPDAALLGLLNVKFVVSSFALRDPALTPLFEVEGVIVYANEKWLPRAFVAGRVERVTDHGTALARLREGSPLPTGTAFVVEPPPLPLEDSTPHPANTEIVERRSGYYRVEASGARPGWLVLSETWAPGWRARLDGAPARVFRTDYALLGLYLPAGNHTVEFEYAPRGWQIGWPMAVAGLVGLTGWAIVRGRRSRLFRRRFH